MLCNTFLPAYLPLPYHTLNERDWQLGDLKSFTRAVSSFVEDNK